MRIHAHIKFSFIALALVLFIAPIGYSKEPVRENYVQNEVLVRFHSWVDQDQKETMRKSLDARLVNSIESIRVEYWKLPSEIPTEETVEYLMSLPEIDHAEPNYLYKPNMLPSDSSFNKQWYLHNTGQDVNGTIGVAGADISANEAWKIERGHHSVVIAVIDSGVAYDHPDLSVNTWVNVNEIPDNGIDDDSNGYVDDIHGWDFVNDDNSPLDYSSDIYGDGHGTHVAGTIAAQGNNELGLSGVMWNAQIMPLQIFDLFQTNSFLSAYIQEWMIVSAIEYAVANSAKIINCSFGGGPNGLFMYDAIEEANKSGVLVVIAAGNGKDNNDNDPTYPASYDLPNIISVAATNEDDNLSSYSNYGSHTVDIAAPGGSGLEPNIYSTTPPQRANLFHDDFESGIAKWVTSGINNLWEIDYNFEFLSNVATDSSLWAYSENELSILETSSKINIDDCRGLHLQFDIDYSLESGYDFLYIEESNDGISYEVIDMVSGFSDGIMNYQYWKNEGELEPFFLRFRLVSDYSNNYDGVLLDNIYLTGVPWNYDGDEYDYKSGTSMAAPVVSGIAGLIWSANHGLSHLEVKDILLSSVDRLASLNGKVLSGGRVNAYKALKTAQRSNQTLYFPYSDIENGWEAEICIINQSQTQNLAGTLKAYTGSGAENGSVTVNLTPNARKELKVSEQFPQSHLIAYLVFESTSGAPCGYAKLYVDGKYRTAVPAATPNISANIFIPHIACNPNWWWTKVVLLNTTTEGKMVYIDFNTGDSWGTYLAAGEQYRFTMQEFFEGNPPEGLRSAVVSNAEGIVGLELFGSTGKSSQNYLSGVLLKGELAQTIHFPHIVEGKVFWTGVVVNNPLNTTADVTVTPYTSDGVQLPPSYVQIGPKEHYFGTMTKLNLTTEAAWIEIKSTSPVVGFELFGTHDGNRMAGYTGVYISNYDGIFPKLEKNGWTGMSFVNLEDDTATIQFKAYNDNGSMIAVETLEVDGYSKVIGIARDIFVSDLSQATYLTYSSDKEVVAFQLNNDNSQTMLDGL